LRASAGLIVGYQGSAYAKIPYGGKNKPESREEANHAHARLSAPHNGDRTDLRRALG